MKRYYTLGVLVLGLALIGGGCATAPPVEVDDAASTTEIESDGTTEVSEMVDEPTTRYEGSLEDVTGGNASGTAIASWLTDSKRYELSATFSDLPELEDDFFYEGWVVRKEPLRVISTGALEREDADTWSNVFTSDDDLTDHTTYILTLEPDDGDPAPAEHVLEGELEPTL